MANSYVTNVIVLYSDMNPGDEVYIIPEDVELTDRIQEVAEEAYSQWFSVDDSENDAYYAAIGDYISERLADAGFKEDGDYLMFFGAGWSDD